jgi:hypothetical protein
MSIWDQNAKCWLYKSRATYSRRLHQKFISSRLYVGCRKDHVWIQCVASGITCLQEFCFALLKYNHYGHSKAPREKRKLQVGFVPSLSYPPRWSQLPKWFVIFFGGDRLKAIWKVRQTTFASGHSIKRWCIVSSWSQWHHFFDPCKFSKLNYL